MQTANLIVAIGNDQMNTVPLYGVTAAEIAVLQAVHGPDAIRDIEPAGEAEDDGAKRTNRAERARLKAIYGRAERDLCPIEALYPGAAARVFETIDELGLPEQFFKPLSRTTANAAPSEKAVKAARGSRNAAVPAASTVDDDGVKDMAFN